MRVPLLCAAVNGSCWPLLFGNLLVWLWAKVHRSDATRCYCNRFWFCACGESRSQRKPIKVNASDGKKLKRAVFIVWADERGHFLRLFQMLPACQKKLGPLHDRVSEKRGKKNLDSLPVLLTDDKTRFVLKNTSIKKNFCFQSDRQDTDI